MSSKVKQFVLVYGTLKRTLHNSYLLKNSKFIGYDSVTGALRMFDMRGLPGVTRNATVIKDTVSVHGELYAVDDDILTSLDLLEGHPDWYRRERLKTDIHDKSAWVYLQPYQASTKYPAVTPAIWRPDSKELEFWLSQGQNLREAG